MNTITEPPIEQIDQTEQINQTEQKEQIDQNKQNDQTTPVAKAQRKNIRITKEVFIARSSLIHNNKFNYDEIEFSKASSLVKNIICPDHGKFNQLGDAHLVGKNGCTSCPDKNGVIRKHTKETFTLKAKEIWNDEIDYSEINYTSMVTYITKLKCVLHNEYFSQKGVHHTEGRFGCKSCIKFNMKNTKRELLKDKNPELFLEIDIPSNIKENADFDQNKIAKCSTKIIWWKCKSVEHHRWKANVFGRYLYKYGCPYCGGTKIEECNSILVKQPELMKEWDYEKNKDLDPSVIGECSHISAWWICPLKNCSYQCVINYRSKNRISCYSCFGYGFCYEKSFGYNYPELLLQWSSDNEISPYDIKCSSNEMIIWECNECNNKWTCSVSYRSQNHGHCNKCKTAGYSRKAMEWMRYLLIYKNVNVRHALNGGEYCPNITDSEGVPRKWRLDGYCEETRIGYEFYGDFWHGHQTRYDPTKMNSMVKKTFGELHRITKYRERMMMENDIDIEYIWESEWDELKKTLPKDMIKLIEFYSR